MRINSLKYCFFTSFFAPCYLDKFCVYLFFCSWSHFHFFFILCLLFLTVLNINSDDTFTLWLDSFRFNGRSWIQQNHHYYKAILLTQCKMKFICVWGHVLFIFFYSHSQNIILWLVFISPVNVPNYFRIIYKDHL